MTSITDSHIVQTKIFLLCLAILLLTFLRPVLLPLLPIILVFCMVLFNGTLTKSSLLIIAFSLTGMLFANIYVEENVTNSLLSLYIFIPLNILFFSNVQIKDLSEQTYLSFFIKTVSLILIANNVIGFFQVIIYTGNVKFDDDLFLGFYGTHGLAMHILSLVNFLFSTYYFFLYKHTKTISSLFLFLFFLLSGILCFFGLGLLIFILTIFIYNFTFKNFIQFSAIFLFVLVFLAISLYYLKKETFNYNYENLKKATLVFEEKKNGELNPETPRKFLAYKNYLNFYSQDFFLIIFGSGPGTFNSRTYFLLNGDYGKTDAITSLVGIQQPSIAQKLVFPLWNKKLTSVPYQDGTRNQPFSSILTLLAEYGLLTTLLLSIMVYKRIMKFNKTCTNIQTDNLELKNRVLILKKFISFSSLFIFLNLFVDNYLEYPELILLFLVIFKLVEVNINKIKKLSYSQNLN